MSRYKNSEVAEPREHSKCSSFLYYTWKIITCIFSHITLMCMVVLYCLLGAWAFAKLEANNEIKVKLNIANIRSNVTDYIWLISKEMEYFEEVNWTSIVKKRLEVFENDLLLAMTRDGWDGNENVETIQWTFSGALFYSIIVITTIGYGHIAPKTQLGKVVTIFYAILGIPLMLLCLSNIGDIMATSFRFLYWKVCCYVCTRKPKRKRHRSVRSVGRSQGRYSTRSRTASFRRSARTSQKSADSGFGFSEISPVSYSDTDLRYHEAAGVPMSQHQIRGSSLPRMRASQISRFSDSSVPVPAYSSTKSHQTRGGSLDNRKTSKAIDSEADKTPVLCNKYVIDKMDGGNSKTTAVDISMERRSKSMPRTQNYLQAPSAGPSDYSEMDSIKADSRKRTLSPMSNPSPSIMSPMGFTIHRQKYYDDQESDVDYYSEGMYSEGGRTRIKPVPIWLCVFLVVSYIFGGAFLFRAWENWSYLDSAYFCFITLTTIGFGDFVPAKRVAMNAEVSIALCSLYLLFGISLLAMSFNLVQEEVIANVKSVAKTLGIIKNDEEEDEEDE